MSCVLELMESRRMLSVATIAPLQHVSFAPPTDEQLIEQGYEKMTWDGQEIWAVSGEWSMYFVFKDEMPLFPPEGAPEGWKWEPTEAPDYRQMVADLGLDVELIPSHAAQGWRNNDGVHVSIEVRLGAGTTPEQFNDAVAKLPDLVQAHPNFRISFCGGGNLGVALPSVVLETSPQSGVVETPPSRGVAPATFSARPITANIGIRSLFADDVDVLGLHADALIPL